MLNNKQVLTKNLIERLNTLKRLLMDELKLHQRLLNIAEEKKNLLVEANNESLEGKTLEEHQLLMILSSTASNRIKILQVIASELSIKNEQVTVGEIARELPDPYRTTLSKLVIGLKQVMHKSHKINLVNRVLLENSISIANDFVNTLTKIVTEQNTYTKKGNGKFSQNMQIAINEVI